MGKWKSYPPIFRIQINGEKTERAISKTSASVAQTLEIVNGKIKLMERWPSSVLSGLSFCLITKRTFFVYILLLWNSSDSFVFVFKAQISLSLITAPETSFRLRPSFLWTQKPMNSIKKRFCDKYLRRQPLTK